MEANKDEIRLAIDALERIQFRFNKNKDGSWEVSPPWEEEVRLRNDREMHTYAMKRLAEAKRQGLFEERPDQAPGNLFQMGWRARLSVAALVLSLVTILLVFMALRYAGFLDHAFYLLVGLALVSLGVTVRIASDLFGAEDDGECVERSRIATRVGWVGTILMLVGVLMSLYSETLKL